MKQYVARTRQPTFIVSEHDPHGIAWDVGTPHPGLAVYEDGKFIEYVPGDFTMPKQKSAKKKKGQSPVYKWNEVVIKKELVLTPIKNCEVPDYVRKYLPKIKTIDWYWSTRKKKAIIVICFRNKKDATAFRKKIKES